MQQKENLFSAVLIDTYKSFIEDRFKVPDNANLLDLAIKLCQHEINSRKNPEKYVPTQVYNSSLNANIPVASMNSIAPVVNLPSITTTIPTAATISPATTTIASIPSPSTSTAVSSSTINTNVCIFVYCF